MAEGENTIISKIPRERLNQIAGPSFARSAGSAPTGRRWGTRPRHAGRIR
jgi:hypothetical protein